MSDAQVSSHPTANGHDNEKSLFDQICEALDTELPETESIEEFKIRVVTDFSDMEEWPDSKYEELSKELQDWIYEATIIHKGNTNKKRKKALPVLPGLDPDETEEKTKKRGRATLSDAPTKVRGRTRTSGDDCLTRTMKLLVTHATPDSLKATELVDLLEAKYDKKYSAAAVRYAQQAFITARTLINAA